MMYWVDVQADQSLLLTQVLLKVLSCAGSFHNSREWIHVKGNNSAMKISTLLVTSNSSQQTERDTRNNTRVLYYCLRNVSAFKTELNFMKT